MTIAQTHSFVDKVTAWHLAQGRGPNCALIVWLQDQRERTDTDTVRAEMIARDDWEPAYSIEALRAVLEMHTADKAAQLQVLYAQDIADATYGDAGGNDRRLRHRAALERLIRDSNDQIADDAWPYLLTWFDANHPNPKLFFAQQPVLEKVPDSIDLTELPCPAKPQFAGAELIGEKPPVSSDG